MTGKNPIQEFSDCVATLHEPDFGDFKRKIELYLSRLEAELKTSPEARGVLRVLRDHVIYNPNGHVESTRQFILKKCRELSNAPRGVVA